MRTLSRIFGAWAWSIVLIAGAAVASASDHTILVFGDSLSAAYGLRPEQGWVALLDKRLKTQGYGYELVNASISGETTSGGAQRLARALSLHKPGIVVLELGANDGLRALPVEIIRGNLEKMVALAKQSGARVLLVGMRIPPNYGPRYTTDFMQMYHQLATKESLRLVPFLLESVALDPSRMQGDGMHPNASGEPYVLDTLWPQLEPMLKK